MRYEDTLLAGISNGVAANPEPETRNPTSTGKGWLVDHPFEGHRHRQSWAVCSNLHWIDPIRRFTSRFDRSHVTNSHDKRYNRPSKRVMDQPRMDMLFFGGVRTFSSTLHLVLRIHESCPTKMRLSSRTFRGSSNPKSPPRRGRFPGGSHLRAVGAKGVLRCRVCSCVN